MSERRGGDNERFVAVVVGSMVVLADNVAHEASEGSRAGAVGIVLSDFLAVLAICRSRVVHCWLSDDSMTVYR